MEKSFIEIKNIMLMCRLGVSSDERICPQKVFVTCRLYTSFMKCEMSDEIEDTVDYSGIMPILNTLAFERSFNLIEHLACKIRELIHTMYDIERVDVHIKKPNVVQGVEYVAYSSIE